VAAVQRGRRVHGSLVRSLVTGLPTILVQEWKAALPRYTPCMWMMYNLDEFI